MKSQRIPEHKLNVTTTVGQAVENITSTESGGGFNMKKENASSPHDESNLNLKSSVNDEGLEISSTGYGLESVSKESEQPKQVPNFRNPSCGGL